MICGETWNKKSSWTKNDLKSNPLVFMSFENQAKQKLCRLMMKITHLLQSGGLEDYTRDLTD